MTTLHEAAQQALGILCSEFTTVDGEFCRWCDGRLNAKHNCALEQTSTALRAALAQQDEPVEPVAWMFTDREGTEFFEQREDWDGWWTPLYTAPPQRKPLTEEEIDNICRQAHGGADPQEWARNFARAIERAHGIGEQP